MWTYFFSPFLPPHVWAEEEEEKEKEEEEEEEEEEEAIYVPVHVCTGCLQK